MPRWKRRGQSGEESGDSNRRRTTRSSTPSTLLLIPTMPSRMRQHLHLLRSLFPARMGLVGLKPCLPLKSCLPRMLQSRLILRATKSRDADGGGRRRRRQRATPTQEPSASVRSRRQRSSLPATHRRAIRSCSTVPRLMVCSMTYSTRMTSCFTSFSTTCSMTIRLWLQDK